MIKRRHQNEMAILVILLVISAYMGISNIPLATLQSAEAALLGCLSKSCHAKLN
jgi:hypothetical protein